MSKFKRKNDNNSEERLENLVHDNMTRDELLDLLNKVRNRIKTNNGFKSTDLLNVGELERIAYSLLNKYDSLQDRETARKILELIGDELIKTHHGELYDEIDDMVLSYRKGMKLLNRIHSKTLIDGNGTIPSNITKKYIKSIMGLRPPGNLLLDKKLVSFLVRLGESDFVVKRPEEYKELINDIVLDQLKNNPTLAQDPNIATNRDLLDMLIQYVRTVDFNKTDSSSDIEIIDTIRLIEKVFGNYIDSLPAIDKNFIINKIHKYSSFEFRTLKKDITGYISFADFMADANVKKIEQDPVAPHNPRIITPVNHGTKTDNVMVDNDKFKAIQEAIVHLRKINPKITVGTVLVGVKAPFYGYIIFPLENVPGKLEKDETEKASVIGTNLVLSEIFGNVRGGSLYIMTKPNADRIFSVTDPTQVGINNGPGTRTISKLNRPGLVTVHHYTQDGLLGYEQMVFEALDDILTNPNINREYRTPRRHIRGAVGNPQQVQKTGAKTVAANTTSTKKVVKATYFVHTSRDLNDYDEIGICAKDLNAVETSPSDMVKYSEALIDDVKSKYADGNGLADAVEFKLIDHVIKKMFIEDKNIEDISKEIADTYNVDPLQAFIYIKSIIVAMAQLDPTHATETLKNQFKSENERMTKEIEEMKLSKEAKEARLKELEERIEKIKKMFDGEGR